MSTHTGSTFALAAWFTPGRSINGPADDFERDEILTEIYNETRAYGVSGNTVIVRTDKGRCMIEAMYVQGCPMVTFDYAASGRWEHKTFWMNASSVADLGDRLRARPELRADFTDLMINE